MSTPWNPSGQDPQNPGQNPQNPGQPGQQPSYGSSSQPGQQPSYGSSSQPGQNPQQPQYGQPTQPQPQQPPYGQPGQPAFGQQPNQPGFGQPAQAGGFGQPAQPGAGGTFGGSSQPPGYGGYGGPGGPGGQGPKKSPLPIIIGVVVGILVIVGIFFAINALTGGGDDDPTADPTTSESTDEETTPEETETTSEEETTEEETTDDGGVTEIADTEVVPGDCILSIDYNENNLWEKVDCSTPHEFEVVAESVTDAEEFPGEDTLSSEAEAFCTDAVVPFFDMVADSESVNYNYMWPTEGTWDFGDRKYTCLMVAVDGAMFTGSFIEGDVTVS